MIGPARYLGHCLVYHDCEAFRAQPAKYISCSFQISQHPMSTDKQNWTGSTYLRERQLKNNSCFRGYNILFDAYTLSTTVCVYSKHKFAEHVLQSAQICNRPT